MFIENIKKMNEILNKVNKKPKKKTQSEIFELEKKRNYNRERKRKVEVRGRPQGRKNRVRRAKNFY